MYNPEELEQLYSRTSEATQAKWRAYPEAGRVKEEAFYDPHKLAITSGIQPALTGPLHRLVSDINQLAQRDALADAMPLNGLHFTFFAITMPLYTRADIANKDRELQSMFAEHAENLAVTISNLRLVALPNQLLIAGTPDAQSDSAKEAFARQLVDSPWRQKLRERHGDISLPPPFWHSTLLRYQADYLPTCFREYFFEHQAERYGAVSAQARLAFTNYNWTEVHYF